MATAREIRAAVRAQHAQQVRGRQDAALAVAAACDKVEKVRERLTAAERQAGAAVTSATAQLPLADLAALAGVPVSELRRLVRLGKHASGPEQSGSAAEQPGQPEPAGDLPAAVH